MTMTKREKVLVSIVLVMAIVCFYFLFYLKPNMDELRLLSSDIADKEALASSVMQQKQIIASIDKAIEENEARIESMSGGITTGFDQPDVLVYLEKTVNEYATKTTFAFDTISQTGQLYVCPIKISMVGSFDGFKKLMAAFNDSPYFIKVVAVEITTPDRTATPDTEESETLVISAPSSPVAKNGEINVTLNIELYSRPGQLEEGKTYKFAEGYQYGGDIFY